MRALRAIAVLAVASTGGCGGGAPPSHGHAIVRPAPARAPVGPVGVARSTARLHRCRVPAEAANGGLLGAAVGGATCTTARTVLIRISHWSGRRCWTTCPRHARLAGGYACDTFKIGEADWSIDCRRRHRVVHARMAD